MQNNSNVARRNAFKQWVEDNDGEVRVAKLYGVDRSRIWRAHSGPGDKPLPKLWRNIMKMSEENAALRQELAKLKRADR